MRMSLLTNSLTGIGISDLKQLPTGLPKMESVSWMSVLRFHWTKNSMVQCWMRGK